MSAKIKISVNVITFVIAFTLNSTKGVSRNIRTLPFCYNLAQKGEKSVSRREF